MNLHKTTQQEDVKSMDYPLQNSEISFLSSASEVRSASCPKPVKPWGKILQHPTKWRLDLSQTQYRCFGEDKNPLALPGFNCWLSSP